MNKGIRVKTKFGNGTIIRHIPYDTYQMKHDKTDDKMYVCPDDIVSETEGIQTRAANAYAKSPVIFTTLGIQKIANREGHSNMSDSYMRMLRKLRKDGIIDYELVNKREAKYRKLL